MGDPYRFNVSSIKIPRDPGIVNIKVLWQDEHYRLIRIFDSWSSAFVFETLNPDTNEWKRPTASRWAKRIEEMADHFYEKCEAFRAVVDEEKEESWIDDWF